MKLEDYIKSDLFIQGYESLDNLDLTQSTTAPYVTGEDANFTLNSFVNHSAASTPIQVTSTGTTGRAEDDQKVDWKNFVFLCDRNKPMPNMATAAKVLAGFFAGATALVPSIKLALA